jgi:hypothetical protein
MTPSWECWNFQLELISLKDAFVPSSYGTYNCAGAFGDHAATHGTRDNQQALQAVTSARPRRCNQPLRLGPGGYFTVHLTPLRLMLSENRWVNIVASMSNFLNNSSLLRTTAVSHHDSLDAFMITIGGTAYLGYNDE